jgi:NRAMP (natural resistance-associated macrophage protein)-like metal ion transporter
MNFLRKLKENIYMRNIIIFLGVLGPGIITGSVDNDAGGITTYSVAGAVYGYHLLWTLIPSFIALVTIQEMNARMGVVTGKGLADLIRENFGVKVTFYIFICLLMADIGNTATEFAGIAGSFMVFNISKYISVPLSAMVVWILVVKGTYKSSERIFLVFSFFLLSYIISAVMAKPDWNEIGSAVIAPSLEWDEKYLGMIMGIIGTTIAPWMQFYMQSAVIEKGIKIEEYQYVQWDVFLGAIATVVIAFFIIVACASTLNVNHITINEAKDAAIALRPLAGSLASFVFAFGLFVASIFSATILPLATAFYVCEGFGFEAGIDKKFNEAPQFYSLFSLIILTGVIIILIPDAPLIAITIWTQILNAILLPVVLICMIIMVNNKRIMGEYVNNTIQNIIGISTTALLIFLSTMLIIMPMLNNVLKIF